MRHEGRRVHVVSTSWPKPKGTQRFRTRWHAAALRLHAAPTITCSYPPLIAVLEAVTSLVEVSGYALIPYTLVRAVHRQVKVFRTLNCCLSVEEVGAVNVDEGCSSTVVRDSWGTKSGQSMALIDFPL
ncbi:unnamed protein product [Ectocarpus sp. 13 AM-2016]